MDGVSIHFHSRVLQPYPTPSGVNIATIDTSKINQSQFRHLEPVLQTNCSDTSFTTGLPLRVMEVKGQDQGIEGFALLEVSQLPLVIK